jgi:uncharacterized membrane protein
MKYLKPGLTFLFGVIMVLGGINHFLKPEMYYPFIPDFLPQSFITMASGVLEIVLGIGAFIPATRYKATIGIFILMILFLPLHIWDVFKEHPAIGSHLAAIIRVPVQFLFIFVTWYISRRD